jgi:serine acetyltransferase
LFAGAKIFGGIQIGEDCKIGANTVVNFNVPDNTSVAASKPTLRNRQYKK